MWNRCDCCGRFIGLKEFKDGRAVRNLLTPDSHYSVEEYETVHIACDAEQAATRIFAAALAATQHAGAVATA